MSESSAAANLDERKSRPCLVGKEVMQTGKRKAEKEKAGPAEPAKAIRWNMGQPRSRMKFYSTQRTGLERVEGSLHNSNIKQWREGVKKEQVKE